MTFKHKLSARLARLWRRRAPAAALITVAVVFGCLRVVPSDAGTLARLVILPPLVSLAVNQTTDFVAFGISDANDTVAVAVQWTATGGTITDATQGNGVHKGHFKAPGQTGQYKVSANDPVSGKSDTAAVVVTSTVIPIASVAVIPESASATVGGTVQFVAVPLDSTGTALGGRVISWSSSNTSVATVDSSGVAQAVAAGSATITATSEGRSGTAAITVVAAPPPPPPVPVASVTVTPSSAGVSVGGTVQLAAVARDSAGNILQGRTMAWSSSSLQIATVAAGLVAGVAAGTAYIVASSEGKSDTASITVTFVPVASVTVSPSSASVNTGAFVQLTATTKDANGNTLTGRAVSWASGSTAIATVNSTGRVAGVAAGSATITATSEGISDSSAVTVLAPPPPPPPPPGGTCLNQAGPSLTVSGLSTSDWSNTSLADNTKVDARTARWLMGPSQLGTYVMIGGGSGLCWSGGEVMAQDPPDFPYSGNYHDIYGINVHAANVTVENVRVFTGGDGITFDYQGSANWTVRGMYIRYMRDDCIENDFLNNGLIDDVLAEGCYTFVSSRTYTGSPDGTNNTVTVQNSLVWLEQMDAIYPSLTAPGTGGFFKWVGSGTPNTSNGPSLVINNTVFRADAVPVEGDGAGEYFAPPKLKSCSNNVMVWLGTGPLPASLPSCFTVMTGSAGLDYWNSRVAAWKAAHPAGPDFAPPIVALWAVPSTLSGTVTLQATAVDDQAVAGVQFLLNGQPIGSEVLPNQVDKARLSWDSRTKPNGIYTLTATARDAAGQTKTSAGIPVTISN